MPCPLSTSEWRKIDADRRFAGCSLIARLTKERQNKRDETSSTWSLRVANPKDKIIYFYADLCVRARQCSKETEISTRALAHASFLYGAHRLGAISIFQAAYRRKTNTPVASPAAGANRGSPFAIDSSLVDDWAVQNRVLQNRLHCEPT